MTDFRILGLDPAPFLPLYGLGDAALAERHIRRRLMSLRAFDAAGMMVDADVVEGREIEPLIDRLFAHPAVTFIQAHHARRGCYAARIERA